MDQNFQPSDVFCNIALSSRVEKRPTPPPQDTYVEPFPSGLRKFFVKIFWAKNIKEFYTLNKKESLLHIHTANNLNLTLWL